MKFEILKDSAIDYIVELNEFPIKVGKLATSQLHLDDASVSRMHARIDMVGENVVVNDLGSATGTYVNGQKVMKRELGEGDILKFGDIEMRVRVVDDYGEIDEGETMALEMPDMDSIDAADAKLQELISAKPQRPAPANPSAPVAATPRVAPAAQRPGVGAAAPAAAGFGGFNPFQKQAPTKKKRTVSFERRFLSERYRGGNAVLEIAYVWRGDVMSIRQFKAKPGSSITVGGKEKVNATYPIEDAKFGVLRPILICNDANQWELVFSDWMNGFILDKPEKLNGVEKKDFSRVIAEGLSTHVTAKLSDKSAPILEQIVRESQGYKISGDTRVKLTVGEIDILIHYVSEVAAILPFLDKARGGIGMWLGILASFLIHFSFFAAVLFATDRVGALSIDRLLTTSRFAEALISPEEEEKPKVEEDEQDEEAPEEDEGAKAAMDEGKTGRDDSQETDGKFAIDGASDAMALSKEQNTQAAMSAGLLAQANEMSSLLGTGFQAQGFDAVDAWGNFDSSAAMGNVAGNYGLGMAGAGRGGGGSNMGGFGTGRFGTAGRGGGGGAGGRAYGSNVSDLGSKKEGKPILKPGAVDVSGSLDRRIIQKVVRDHRRELSACYEKELAKVKGLRGEIKVRWIIDTRGTVTHAVKVSSSMNNKNVEDCVVNSIKYWRFPAPKGGAPVQVDYPFNFIVE
ncbi:MAG: AgmX/PglI C-terminal domain-containing protein [Bradymonadales bacterium]|jgi:TonB family protein